jgi:nicotinate-nucleotide pyrophosphorylase (carboxylating)
VTLVPAVHLDRLILLALEEDLPAGDVTTAAIVPDDRPARGRFVARAPLVLAGTAAALRVFALVDPGVRLRFLAADGTSLGAGDCFGEAEGSAAGLLAGERTALNLLQRLSGVATLTRRYVDAVAGTAARLCDTRKTTPGMRALEKQAVRAGGGHNHRSSLSDGVLIKTNHVRVAGSVGEAVRRALERSPHPLRIEVEVRDLAELDQGIAAGADICLLDNMSLETIREAVKRSAGRVLLEASGGVSLDTVRAIAATGVNLISVGRLTHSAPAADLAFEVEPLAAGAGA